jgi:hypothetical protein
VNIGRGGNGCADDADHNERDPRELLYEALEEPMIDP